MQALLVKMSSMGDILHTFPALSDLQRNRPGVTLHWVVEKSFSELAGWHPMPARIIPVQQRKWLRDRDRKSLSAFRTWRRNLREESYDLVLDSQSLIKSALIARQARRTGELHGRHPADIRESPAGWLYSRRHRVSTDLHAIEQARQLFALTFDYQVIGPAEFGIRSRVASLAPEPAEAPVMLVPGTTWPNKHWHLSHWQTLAQALNERGLPVEVIWGSPGEKEIARTIQSAMPQARVAEERLSIPRVAGQLAHARAVIGMDTGFSHIAGALGTPTLALYGPTSPDRYGLVGNQTRNMTLDLDCQPCHRRQCRWLPSGSQEAPPCLRDLTPEQVLAWPALDPDTRLHLVR